MKVEFPGQIFEKKSSNIKFVKICTLNAEVLHVNRRTYRQAGWRAGKYFPPPWLFVKHFISHTIGPTALLHPSPALHFKTFQVFLIYFSKCPSFSTTQSYAPNLAIYWFLP